MLALIPVMTGLSIQLVRITVLSRNNQIYSTPIANQVYWQNVQTYNKSNKSNWNS